MSGGEDIPTMGFDAVAEKESVRRVLAEHAGSEAYREVIREVGRQVAAEREALQPALEQLRASVIRRQAETLLDLIDERIQNQRIIHAPFGAGVLAQVLGYCKNLFRSARPLQIKYPEHGDLEVAQHSDIELQLAELIFELAHVDLRVSGHCLPPFRIDEVNPNPRGDGAHRLCESQK